MSAIGTRTGVGGSATIPSGFGLPVNLHIKEWREDVTRAALDDTDFETTDNAEEVVGGLLSRTITIIAKADRADHPKMTSIASAITNTNEQPIASLVLQEGQVGTGGATPATTTVSALLTGVSRGVVKATVVEYNLTFRGSGAAVQTT